MKKKSSGSKTFWLFLVGTSIWTLSPVACRPAAKSSALQDLGTAPSDRADLRWLDKASRVLRLGKALSPNDPLRQYVNQPKSVVVDALFRDPMFFPTMIDFYGYYFGFKADASLSKKSVFQNLSYDPTTKNVNIEFGGNQCDKTPSCVHYPAFYLDRNLFHHPAALHGALIVSEEKSVDELYRPIQPSYATPGSLNDILTNMINFSQLGSDRVEPISLDTIRQKIEGPLKSMAQVLESEIDQAQGETIQGLCAKVNKAISSAENLLFSLEAVMEIGLTCPQSPDLSVTQAKHLLAQNAKVRASTRDLFAFLEAYLSKKLTVQKGVYFEIPANLRKVWKNALYGQTFWRTHLNSSTNYNRKRAAYVLKTFFCDDLTPVKLEIAAHPGDDRHATDPSCMACHYKLDPLAGFFRNHGSFGMDFEGKGLLAFDDGKIIAGSELDQYLASWKFAAGQKTNGGLNVGLIRSSTDASKNTYGRTLEDLGRLVAQDPRTFMCKTQRLADYFIGGGLTYDRKWLEGLAQTIQSAPKSRNGAAIKSVIKSLLLSRSFSTEDPVDGVCYDRVAAKESGASLDCVVSSTIEKYCFKCHSAGGSEGGLDLSTWSAETGFTHENAEGKPLSAKLSYQKILDRLGPSESGPIMPLNSPMPDPDRRALIQWFEKQLDTLK